MILARPSKVDMTNYSIADCLCESHLDEILESRFWPASFVASENDCCWNSFRQRGAPMGEYHPFSDLPDGDRIFLMALHEAAHAAACIELLHHIEQMKLDAYPGMPATAGFVFFLYHDPRDLFAEAVINLAGACAQQAWLEQHNLYDDRHQIDSAYSTKNDLTVVHDLLDREAIAQAWDYTVTLVAELWPAIIEIAAALLDAGELDHATVEQIYVSSL